MKISSLVGAEPARTFISVSPQENAAPAATIAGISPRAKATAEKHTVDLRQVEPTGPKGRVIERDIFKLIDEGKFATDDQVAAMRARRWSKNAG